MHLFSIVYKFSAGAVLRWTSIPSRGEGGRKTDSSEVHVTLCNGNWDRIWQDRTLGMMMMIMMMQA